MVGVGVPPSMPTSKPSRSDELGTPDEQEQRFREVQRALDANAPKRTLKPARSDAAEQVAAAEGAAAAPSGPGPEYLKYQELLAHSTPLDTAAAASDEYTESGYYESLGSIGKEHHTTGTGFITVGGAPLEGFCLSGGEAGPLRTRRPGNPGVDDWVPAPGAGPAEAAAE